MSAGVAPGPAISAAMLPGTRSSIANVMAETVRTTSTRWRNFLRKSRMSPSGGAIHRQSRRLLSTRLQPQVANLHDAVLRRKSLDRAVRQQMEPPAAAVEEHRILVHQLRHAAEGVLADLRIDGRLLGCQQFIHLRAPVF